MHKVYRAAAASVLALASAPASSAQYLFSQGGYAEGATLTGSFTGADGDSNGQISSFAGEVTDFSATFSGNSTVGPLSFTFADLFGLVYDLDGDIGDGLSLDVEGIGASNGIDTYFAGPGPLALCDGVATCGQVSNGQSATGTTELVLVTAGVPEPSTWAMMLIGFGALGGALRWSKRATRSLQPA
jgi:PEP-CTERM motif